jgi:hypothetical protein
MGMLFYAHNNLRCRPTLPRLQQRFTENMSEHSQYQPRLTTTIDWIFRNGNLSIEAFRQALLQEKIRTVEERDGRERRLFYIDDLAKTVYEGDRLGWNYSAEGIESRCIPEGVWRREQSLKQEQQQNLRQRPRIDLY